MFLPSDGGEMGADIERGVRGGSVGNAELGR